MAAPKGKAPEVKAEDAVKDAPIVADLKAAVEGVQAGVDAAQADETTPLSPEDRQGALANLLGAAVVAPAADVKPADAPDVWTETTPEAPDDQAELSAVVTSTRFHVPTDAGRKTYHKGQIVTAARAVIERGIAIGCLKANG